MNPAGTISRNRLDPRVSLIYLALWFALLFHGWGGLATEDPNSLLHYPAATAARLSSRSIELADAIAASPPQQRTRWQQVEATPEDALSNAIAIHEELIASLAASAPAYADGDPSEWSPLDLATLTQVVLLAEAGYIDESCQLAEAIDEIGDTCGLLAHLYLDAPAQVDAPEAEALAEALEDWPGDRLRLREAARAGDAGEVARIEASSLERGARSFDRSRLLFFANWGLVGAGLLVLLAWPMLRISRAGNSPLQPPWSLADGLGVLIRGDFFSRLYFVALVELPESIAYSALGTLAYDGATLIAALPLLWLVYRHLLRPHFAERPDALGLDPRHRAWGAIAACTLAAIAVELLGTQAIGWGSWWLEVVSPWTEGFDETLVWGTRAEVILTALDYVAWVPALEELGYRGLLYFSLRKRLGVTAAVALSAACFSAVHFYSLTGFLSTFFSGMVWALVFERTRSLLPGIAAHAVYNALFVAGLLLLYR